MALIFHQLLDLAKEVHDKSGKIESKKFLAICQQIIPVIEKFGTSFAIIKSDIGGNIDRLETARGKDPEKYAELFVIVLAEVERGEQGGKYSDTKALLWLKRAMEFVNALLQRLYDDRTVTMSVAASDAYTQTLYKYHTWYTSAAFQLALKLVPYRESFFEKLGVLDESGMAEMEAFLTAFSPILAEVHEFLSSNGLDDPTPV